MEKIKHLNAEQLKTVSRTPWYLARFSRETNETAVSKIDPYEISKGSSEDRFDLVPRRERAWKWEAGLGERQKNAGGFSAIAATKSRALAALENVAGFPIARA